MTLREVEIVTLPTPFGPMQCQVFRPAAEGRFPGVVLFSEIFQITGPIRRTAAYLAGHGFIVVVPEVYHEFLPAGLVLAYDQAGADEGNRLKTTKTVASYDADARACVDFLRQHPAGTGKVGVMGMCLGGHLAYRAALLPEVAAATCLYATDLHKHSLGAGLNDDSLARAAELRGEMLFIWGRQDPHVPDEGRALIYQTLLQAGVLFSWLELNGAHAFIRDEGHRYDPELATLCLGQAVALFRRRLA